MTLLNDEAPTLYEEREHQIRQATEEPETALHMTAVGNQLLQKPLSNYEFKMRSYAALCEFGR